MEIKCCLTRVSRLENQDQISPTLCLQAEITPHIAEIFIAIFLRVFIWIFMF